MRIIKLLGAAALLASTASMAQMAKDEYMDLETREFVPPVLSDLGGAARDPNGPAGGMVVLSFQGISQYDVAAYGRNFIPPDTMGAVGTTQYSEFVNGGFAVYDKATGGVVKATSDVAFWVAAGRTSANGDTRVMFDKASGRWIALSFAASVSNIQIAVSDTSDAAGTWKSTQYTGFAGGTADYPTLALDNNAVYIGTNNFNASGNFRGTTLSIIPKASLFAAGGPTTTGRAAVVTPYSPVTGGADGGYAIQGVNSSSAGTTGRVEAVSLFNADIVRYNINGVNNLPTATLSPVTYVGTDSYDGNGPARQPNAVPDVCVTVGGCSFANNNQVIDTLDDRIGSSVYEVNNRIYSVHTVTPTGGAFTVVRYDVIDATTNKILDEGDIGDGSHDYYQGSLSVNKFGQVVIAYNRSGSGADGKISVLATVFSTGVSGLLTQRGSEILLKTSVVDDYHNGSVDGQVANGRQRWGDYSAVSLDPTNDRAFWTIGEYAREYNDAAGGHPGGTGGSRWSTWISELNVGTAVPEPASWAMMIAGFGFIGAAMRRQRRTLTVSA